jgi:hypothetical protein
MKKFSRQQIKDMNTNKKLPKPPQEAYPLFSEILHDFETSIQPTKKRKIQDLTEFEMETNEFQDGHIHHFDSEITVHPVTPPSTPGQQDHEATPLPNVPLTPGSIVKMGKNTISVEKHFETLYINAALKIKSLEDENAKLKSQIQNLSIAKRSDGGSTELMLQAYHSISRVIAICSGKVAATSSKVIDTRISIFKAGDGIEFKISKNLENLWINTDKFAPSLSVLIRIFKINFETHCLCRSTDGLIKMEQNHRDSFLKLLANKHEMDISTVKHKVSTRGSNIRAKKCKNPFFLHDDAAEEEETDLD